MIQATRTYVATICAPGAGAAASAFGGPGPPTGPDA